MNDNNELKKLYSLCFTEDTKQETDFVFENLLKNALPVTLYKDNVLCSMLFLIECTLNNQNESIPFYYLYAACTHPNYRKQGLMSQLLKLAEKQAVLNKKSGICLFPANQSLYSFYEKCGYKNGFFASYNTFNSVPFNNRIKKIKTADYIKFRKDFLKNNAENYILFNDLTLESALNYYEFYMLFESNTKYAICAFDKGTDKIKELLYSNFESAAALCGGLCSIKNIATLTAKSPVGCGGLSVSDGMILSIGQKQYTDSYIGFVFD